MGIKERRTKILLTLFLLSDVDLSFVDFDERVEKISDLYFNQKTKSSLNLLIKDGVIEKDENAELGSDKKSKGRYRLTEKGWGELSLTFPFLRYLRDTWDGKWRILSYEIPEKKRDLRDRLRRSVSGWGLGPWHRSFWLTPHPIVENARELVKGKDEEQYVQIFESEHVFGDREILIEKVWGKKALEEKYRELFRVWHDTLSKDVDKLEKLAIVVKKYIDVLRYDPGLPKELVGESWIGFESYTIYKEIRSILLS